MVRIGMDVCKVPEADIYFLGGIGRIMETRRRY
jgi:hypothetical protein